MKYGVLNVSQADSMAIFAEHNGVSITELQAKEGRDLNATCYKLAESFQISLANNFVYEDIEDLTRAYKALAFGGSI